jgi:hypothetical protein
VIRRHRQPKCLASGTAGSCGRDWFLQQRSSAAANAAKHLDRWRPALATFQQKASLDLPLPSCSPSLLLHLTVASYLARRIPSIVSVVLLLSARSTCLVRLPRSLLRCSHFDNCLRSFPPRPVLPFTIFLLPPSIQPVGSLQIISSAIPSCHPVRI